MAFRDYVAQKLEVGQNAVFNFDQLYKTMYKWFNLYGYDFQEIAYNESDTKSGKNLFCFWQCTKEVDDYTKLFIEIEVYLNNFKPVKSKNKKFGEGEVKFVFSAYLHRDYEDRWSNKNWIVFFREIVDKYVYGSRTKKYQTELLDNMHKAISEIKAFLRLHKN